MTGRVHDYPVCFVCVKYIHIFSFKNSFILSLGSSAVLIFHGEMKRFGLAM